MSNQLKAIMHHFQQFLEKYRKKTAEESGTLYKIVDIKTDDENKKILIVQLAKKNIIYKFLPKDILADNSLMEGFSKKDVRTITYLACNPEKPKTKIITQEFNGKLNSMVFGIQRFGNKTIIKKTANEISFDKSLVSELTPEEALMVGYMLADENVAHEKDN